MDRRLRVRLQNMRRSALMLVTYVNQRDVYFHLKKRMGLRSRSTSQDCRLVDSRLPLLLLILLGCTDSNDFTEDPPGQWRTGDLHVHATGASNDTGGDSTPSAIKTVAIQRGLDFVVLTDHSNSTGSDPSTREEDPVLFNQGPEFVYWNEAARLSQAGTFLMVSGNELSPVADPPNEPRGHIGCLPGSLQAFDTDSAFIDRPKDLVTGGDALRQARERGCFTVINHPFGQVAWIRYDWTDLNYDALEVFNGGLGFDNSDLEAYNAWRCDLLQGKNVTAIAGSDNHRVNIEAPGNYLDAALGYPSTSVFVQQEGWQGILQGLRAGAVVLHEGDSWLQLDTYDAQRAPAEGASIRWLRLRGRLDARAGVATLRVRRATSCEDPRPQSQPPTVTETMLFERAVRGGFEFDEAVAIDGQSGVYSATLLVDDGRYCALSSAAVIAAP